MMKLHQWLLAGSIAAVLSLGATELIAQQDQGGGGPGGGRRGNFDPAQMQQRMMDR